MVIPEEFKRKQETKPYRRWPYVLAIVLFVILDIAIGYLIYSNYFIKNSGDGDKVDISVTPDSQLTQISSGDQQVNPENGNTEQIQELADAFMQARLSRNIEKAKPYITDRFLSKYDQGAFAGTSSPSLDDYEITDIKHIGGNTYQITAQTTWLLNGDSAGSQDWTLIATLENESYKIDDYSESD